MTISFDHDITDSAPTARFIEQLKELIESGYGLDDSTIESSRLSLQEHRVRAKVIRSKGGYMKTLVVYDSQFGNTKRIAQVIADTLRPFGQAQAVRVDLDRSFKFQGVDLLIVGSPTQGFRPTPVMQAFLGNIPRESLSGLAVACFDTRFRGFLWKNSAAPRMARQLRTLGVEAIIPPESFFVKAMKAEGPLLAGEVERAASWALDVHQQYETQEAHLAAH